MGLPGGAAQRTVHCYRERVPVHSAGQTEDTPTVATALGHALLASCTAHPHTRGPVAAAATQGRCYFPWVTSPSFPLT